MMCSLTRSLQQSPATTRLNYPWGLFCGGGKSCIRETLNLSTDAENSTDTKTDRNMFFKESALWADSF